MSNPVLSLFLLFKYQSQEQTLVSALNLSFRRKFSFNKERVDSRAFKRSKFGASHSFIDNLISQLGTLYASPEVKIYTQYQKSLSMYIVINGNLTVNQKTISNQES